MDASSLRVHAKARCVKNGEISIAIVTWLRFDEEVAGKQGVPGAFGHQPDAQAMRWIGTGDQILDEQFAFTQIRHDPLSDRLVGGDSERLVDLAPPDAVSSGLIDDEFVIGGPSGMFAGRYRQRTGRGERAFAPA